MTDELDNQTNKENNEPFPEIYNIYIEGGKYGICNITNIYEGVKLLDFIKNDEKFYKYSLLCIVSRDISLLNTITNSLLQKQKDNIVKLHIQQSQDNSKEVQPAKTETGNVLTGSVSKVDDLEKATNPKYSLKLVPIVESENPHTIKIKQYQVKIMIDEEAAKKNNGISNVVESKLTYYEYVELRYTINTPSYNGPNKSGILLVEARSGTIESPKTPITSEDSSIIEDIEIDVLNILKIIYKLDRIYDLILDKINEEKVRKEDIYIEFIGSLLVPRWLFVTDKSEKLIDATSGTKIELNV
ncbi:MAG: hypothetical protein ACP5RS_00900 [Thermoplasmata archaeon]